MDPDSNCCDTIYPKFVLKIRIRVFSNDGLKRLIGICKYKYSTDRDWRTEKHDKHAFQPVKLVLLPGTMLREGGSATVGQAMGFNINSKDAGPGQLYVRCQGPSKDCDVTVFDNKDSTFQVQIFPTEVGNHLVYVEWGGRPVHGSPFLVRVGQPPDPSKVRVYGKYTREI